MQVPDPGTLVEGEVPAKSYEVVLQFPQALGVGSKLFRIPERVIRQKLSEIKQGGAHAPAKVFTSAMKAYATAVVQKNEMSSLMSARKDVFRI